MDSSERPVEKVSDTRNEAVTLPANLFSATRKAWLLGLGLAGLALEFTGAAANRLEERGVIAALALRKRIDRALDEESSSGSKSG
ncbi:MAG: hypothetical protein HC802_18625 [Caldilineaceae bacterium]|nr:hypothetical protein [Caldilineaceae bacterium]